MLLPLNYLSEAKLAELRGNISNNVERYVSGTFEDLAAENGWAIEARDVKVDPVALKGLDISGRSAQADFENSRIVYGALQGLTPALAREERVWTRLTHVECLEYSRARWLTGHDRKDIPKLVEGHLFASGLTGVRDDNAVGRLWWNMHIAGLADPGDPDGALRLILRKADFRQAFVERPGTVARRELAQAIVRAMRRTPAITSSEQSFRRFMVVLNRDCGGVLFEALSASTADGIIDACAARALS